MKKKGFVFVETIVVISVLSIALIVIYRSFASAVSLEKRRQQQDNAVYQYRTHSVLEMLSGYGMEYYFDLFNSNRERFNYLSLNITCNASVTVGDGICTKDCDFNEDGTCDFNCDTNSDGTCDLNCDLDNDGRCDHNCDIRGSGSLIYPYYQPFCEYAVMNTESAIFAFGVENIYIFNHEFEDILDPNSSAANEFSSSLLDYLRTLESITANRFYVVIEYKDPLDLPKDLMGVTGDNKPRYRYNYSHVFYEYAGGGA